MLVHGKHGGVCEKHYLIYKETTRSNKWIYQIARIQGQCKKTIFFMYLPYISQEWTGKVNIGKLSLSARILKIGYGIITRDIGVLGF